MKKLVILSDCTIAKNESKVILLRKGEILTHDTLKYRYGVKRYEEKVEALVGAGLAEWQEISKFYNRLTERTRNAHGRVTNRVDRKKVITL